jgi:hypothetical protein
MQPKPADDRLAYFSVAYLDIGQHDDLIDPEVSLISKYDLASLPDRQIKVYIDPMVPMCWREYFREGVEAWNDAFAPIGFPKAVRGILPTDEDWPEDYDPGDARYTTIGWTLDGDQVYSEGIAKVDPRSGEIIKGDIIMSEGWVQSWLNELDHVAPEVRSRPRTGYRREMRPLAAAAAETHLELGAGLRRAGLLSTKSVTRARNGSCIEEELVGQGLKSIAMHEMGHLLGLRHNFKGSLGVSYECTQNRSCSSVHGITASIMDYLPLNVPVGGQTEVHVFSPVIGAYDKLAIAYGYGDAAPAWTEDVPRVSEELEKLLKEAEQFPSCVDEDHHEFGDPQCTPYDLTSEPLRNYEDRLRSIASSQSRLLDTFLVVDEPYTRYGHAVASLLSMAMNWVGEDLVKYVGGVNLTRLHSPGGARQSKPASEPISAAVQDQALSILLRLLRPGSLGLMPPADAKPFLVLEVDGAIEAMDVRKTVRAHQWHLMDGLLAPNRLRTMELTLGDDSSGQLLASIATSIWGTAANGGIRASSPKDDWDLQMLLASRLKNLTASNAAMAELPEVVLSEILYRTTAALEDIDQALTASRAQTMNTTGGGAHAEVALGAGNLLEAHLLRLRQELEVVKTGAMGSAPWHEPVTRHLTA